MLRLNGRLGPGSGKASRGHDEKSGVRAEGEFDFELFSPGSSPAIGDAEFGGLSSAFRSSGFFFLLTNQVRPGQVCPELSSERQAPCCQWAQMWLSPRVGISDVVLYSVAIFSVIFSVFLVALG